MYSRFNRSVSVAELYKMKDTIEIHEQGGAGRMIHLAPALRKPVMDGDQEDSEVSNSIRLQFHNQGLLVIVIVGFKRAYPSTYCLMQGRWFFL